MLTDKGSKEIMFEAEEKPQGLWMTAPVIKVLNDLEIGLRADYKALKVPNGTYRYGASGYYDLNTQEGQDVLKRRKESSARWYNTAIGVYVGTFPVSKGLSKTGARMNHEVLEVAINREASLLRTYAKAVHEKNVPEVVAEAKARWEESWSQLTKLVSLYLGDQA